MRIGARAHDFGKLPADELARRIAATGMSCVQLALTKAIEGIDLRPGQLNSGLAYEIGQAFHRHGVQIAVLGCYINPIHPDPVVRRSLIGFFKEHLRHARDFGNSLVALETGSLNADYSPHPDNQSEEAFQVMLGTFEELVAEAEKFGVVVGVEGVTSHTVSTPARMRRLLDAIPSNNLQVVFDPVNFFSIENHREQERVVRESFEQFGDRIAIVHAKDFIAERNALRTVRAGKGACNYRPVIAWLEANKPSVSILLEEAGEDTAAECAAYLRGAAAP
jgi:sugar phosphate isomerase/epimerase